MEISTKQIASILSTEPTVIAVYLFGSHARSTASKDSDIDIAVATNKKHDYSFFYEKLQTVIDEQYDMREITLDSSPLFLFEVIRNGVVLYEKTPHDRLTFEAQALLRYYDTAYLRTRYSNRLAHAFAEGSYGH